MPDLDMKLVDELGKDISDFNVQGEICIRGPTVVKGYFENPEANARDWDADNFFHTGDIGYCDGKTKNWYIVDRKKASLQSFQSFLLLTVITGAHKGESVSSSPSGA
jgi:4-coumarate--CoA ligase